MDELIAKLDTIQSLLVILLSEPKYKERMEDLERQIYVDYDQQMNRLFPSDPEYRSLEIQSRAIRDAVGEILRNIELSDG